MARKEAAAPVGNNDSLPGLRSRLSMCCVSVVDYRPAPVPLCAAIVPIAIALSLAPVQHVRTSHAGKAPSSKIREPEIFARGREITIITMMHRSQLCSIVIVFAVLT